MEIIMNKFKWTDRGYLQQHHTHVYQDKYNLEEEEEEEEEFKLRPNKCTINKK